MVKKNLRDFIMRKMRAKFELVHACTAENDAISPTSSASRQGNNNDDDNDDGAAFCGNHCTAVHSRGGVGDSGV